MQHLGKTRPLGVDELTLAQFYATATELLILEYNSELFGFIGRYSPRVFV